MSTSSEITPGGAAPALATVALLGAPPLIKGENARGYDDLLARICATLQPTDSLEEIWIRDVVGTWWFLEQFAWWWLLGLLAAVLLRFLFDSRLWQAAVAVIPLPSRARICPSGPEQAAPLP